MNCTVAQKLLQLYLDNALEAVEARAVEQHVSQCAICRAHFVSMERLILAVESLPRFAAPPDFTRQIMARITQDRHSTRFASLWLWVTPALLLILAATGLLFALQSSGELAQSFSEMELSDPLALFESLFMAVASLELSLVVGAALVFVASCGVFLQLVARGQPQPRSSS